MAVAYPSLAQNFRSRLMELIADAVRNAAKNEKCSGSDLLRDSNWRHWYEDHRYDKRAPLFQSIVEEQDFGEFCEEVLKSADNGVVTSLSTYYHKTYLPFIETNHWRVNGLLAKPLSRTDLLKVFEKLVDEAGGGSKLQRPDQVLAFAHRSIVGVADKNLGAEGVTNASAIHYGFSRRKVRLLDIGSFNEIVKPCILLWGVGVAVENGDRQWADAMKLLLQRRHHLDQSDTVKTFLGVANWLARCQILGLAIDAEPYCDFVRINGVRWLSVRVNNRLRVRRRAPVGAQPVERYRCAKMGMEYLAEIYWDKTLGGLVDLDALVTAIRKEMWWAIRSELVRSGKEEYPELMISRAREALQMWRDGEIDERVEDVGEDLLINAAILLADQNEVEVSKLVAVALRSVCSSYSRRRVRKHHRWIEIYQLCNRLFGRTGHQLQQELGLVRICDLYEELRVPGRLKQTKLAIVKLRDLERDTAMNDADIVKLARFVGLAPPSITGNFADAERVLK